MPIRCRHLRTKKLYTGVHPDEAFAEKEQENASPSHYWCNLTQCVVGVDDGQVTPSGCVAPRSCWEE